MSARKADPATAGPALQGVSRALKVLDLIAQLPLRTSDLADELGISWATLQRTVAQLEADGFVYRDERGVFHIGRKTWLLGSTYLVGHRLLELAVPLFNREPGGQPSAVLQLVERSAGSSVVLLSKEGTRSEVITRTTYGHHFPLHCGAKGHVLLSHAPPSFVAEYLSQPLLELTPHTVTDPVRLRDTLDTVRAQGHAVTTADVQLFTGSVAAPIFDADGVSDACVSAIMSKSSMTPERVAQAIDTCQRLSQALSLGLGWKPLQHARHKAAQLDEAIQDPSLATS